MIKIEENVPLAPLTTFRIGGPAKYFARVSSIDELQEAIKFSIKKQLPIFVLGGGSNLIVSDRGFDGIVIKPDFKKLDVNGDVIICGASMPFGALVNTAIQNSLSGLEWAAGIPGTVGGAVRGNAGAFGGETKDVVAEVKSIDLATGKEIVRDNKQCQFGYRESIVKRNQEVIIEVRFELKPGDEEEISQEVNDHIKYRHERHPYEHPSAGSVFKNVPVDAVPRQFIDQFKDAIKTDPFPVVPAAKIIAEAGLSGEKIGGAQVSPKHTNYIINTGGATASDVIALIDKVKSTVKQKFQIDLSPEPQIVE